MTRYIAHHRGSFLQRGRGIGNLLAPLFRFLTPILKRGGSTAVKTLTKAVKSKAGKKILKQAAKSGAEGTKNLIGSAIAGEDVQKTMKTQVQKARKEIGQTIKEAKLSSNGRRTQRGVKRARTTVKRSRKVPTKRTKTIFSET